MSKAIIGIEHWEDMQNRALNIAKRFDAGKAVPESDYYLNFTDVTQLFNELTLNRIILLETIKQQGTVSIITLSKLLGRDHNAIHADIDRLIEHGLIEQTAADTVWTPWEEIQIKVLLGNKVAA